ncbi:MAG: XshC-Cox1 family protein [Ferruginibacter sp.]|nr:XshC-Cox1 family protein [Ferruginibacter sp.]
MKEIKAIVKAYNSIDTVNTSAALATVVRVEGSSYRRTGARMLVLDNGIWVGGISGGCLEGDALKRARLAMAKSVSTLITYDTTEEDAYQIGVGLGCNGIIDVLFTPLNFQDKNNPVEILKACISASRQTHVLITVTRLEGNWEGIKTGDVIKFSGAECLDILYDEGAAKKMLNSINDQLTESKSMPRKFSSEDGSVIEAFIEILPPEINIVIIGYQYDVYPFSRLMKEIGWRVTIVANPQKLNTKITQIADEVISPEGLDLLTVDDHTVIVLMSHDYKTDKYNLPKALATKAPYIGILGPRTRSERILRELEEDGYSILPKDLSRIYAPVGLDIGAVTPEEIALSLAAEVKASLSNREGGFLRLRKSSIHERG